MVGARTFEGRAALVTGGGSGIGRATALRLGAEGAEVAVLDLLADRAEAVRAEIGALGGRARALAADVADEAAMRAAFGTLDRLDLIVANAGINGTWAPLDELTPAEWDRTIAVNLRGAFLTLHLGVPLLKAAGGGAVVVVASVNGTRKFTTGGAVAYAAAKAGQAAMADQLALELARHGIRVNSVLPGRTETRMGENTARRNAEAAAIRAVFPDGDIPLTGDAGATPDAVADAIAYLLGPGARHVTGTRLVVDGGQSLLN